MAIDGLSIVKIHITIINKILIFTFEYIAAYWGAAKNWIECPMKEKWMKIEVVQIEPDYLIAKTIKPFSDVYNAVNWMEFI